MPPNQYSTGLYLLHLVPDDAVKVQIDVLVDRGDVIEDEASGGQDVGPLEEMMATLDMVMRQRWAWCLVVRYHW